MTPIKAALCEVLDEEHADAVIEHRRVTIKKPLTAFAAKILARRLAEWGDANQAAEIMIERCWQGFSRDWIRDRTAPILSASRPRTPSMADYTGQMLDMFNESTRTH